MRRLILVRHGHPEHMDLGLTGGWTDRPLTPRGRAQAERAGRALAAILADEPHDNLALFTSDLQRARQTADHIAGRLGLAASPTPALREQRLGEADHKTEAEAQRLALNPTEGPMVDRVFFPGAETWRAMMERIFAFLDGVAQARPEATTILASHAGAGVGIVFWWLGLERDRWPAIQFEFDLASITDMAVGEHGGRRILRLNDTRHLLDLEPAAS